MSVLNSDMYGGTNAVKKAALDSRGVVLGRTTTKEIPPVSGNGSWGNQTIFEWRQEDVSIPFQNVVKDLLLKVCLPALPQGGGATHYIPGVTLALFSSIKVYSGSTTLTSELDCRNLWPFLTYCTRNTEFQRLAMNLNMLSTDAERQEYTECYLPLDLLFAWANSNVLDIVRGTSIRIEIMMPAYTAVVQGPGAASNPTDIQLVVDREYNTPYVDQILDKFYKGFAIQNPDTLVKMTYDTGLNLPDFEYAPLITNATAIGAADTYSRLDLRPLSNRKVVCLFFYLQSNADLAALTLFNNYKPITNAKLAYASYPLDGSDSLGYKTYPWFHKQIDNIDSLPNVAQYLIGGIPNGRANANMIIIDYSDANLTGVGYTSNAAGRFSGFMNWTTVDTPVFECNFPALGGTGGVLKCVAICYKQLAIRGDPGQCSIVELAR